ncbi:MAG: c-type cytochrome [Myxococcaceae bacterium]
MRRWQSTGLVIVALFGGACGSGEHANASAPESSSTAALDGLRGSTRLVPNAFGVSRTVNAGGGPLEDPSNPFFQSLGTNGRACSTCHVPESGMAMTPDVARRRFLETAGMDPLFRTVDGAVSPLADVSTLRARRQAYGLLLDRALIRVGIGLPEVREFELVAVDDPHGFASATELSLFRRILPSTNLRFLSTVMWDGRETFRDSSSSTGFATLHFDLADQSNAATKGHAQATVPLDDAQREAIISFEMQLFTAQSWDWRAGYLADRGAQGGPEVLLAQEFYFGINDPLGGDPTGRPFDATAMTLYDAWANNAPPIAGREAARAAIARGQEIFNHKPISIVGVSGLNDDLGMTSIPGTCTTCHDAPNAGNHSVPAPLRIGTDLPQPLGGLDVSRLPVYTLQNRVTGEIKTTTDPGRALVTGKWKDIGRFKGPILRGVAARAPYFHNGSAATLEDVIRFYDERFALGFTARERSDLLAFLASL